MGGRKGKEKAKVMEIVWTCTHSCSLSFFNFSFFWCLENGLDNGVTHLLIDGIKLVYQRDKTRRLWFFLDQILHVLVILVCWFNYSRPDFSILFIYEQKIWLLVVGALMLTSPTAIIIKMIIAKWLPVGDVKKTSSLQEAGRYIGMLERLLIFLFVCTHHFEAVGFLLAAKSIFRFGDLKDAHDIKLTEYVLIGTLLSFGIALLVSLAVV